MAVPDFSGFTPGMSTMQKMLDAIRAQGFGSQWEPAARAQNISSPWELGSSFTANSYAKRERALNELGWLTGQGGGGGGGGGTTPAPNPNSNALLQNSLSALGIGAVAGGPNYKISSPFRHLFGQDQIDAFAVKDPASLYKMGGDGKIQQANFNWWQPNASVGAYSPIPAPSSKAK